MTRSLLSVCFIFVLCSLAFASTNLDAKRYVGNDKKAEPPVRSCTGSELSVRADPKFSDSAMGGQRGARYIVKNTSSKPCRITGDAGIALFDKHGKIMGKRIPPSKTGGTTIKAHGQASFEVGYHSCYTVSSNSGLDPKKCRNSSTAQIRFHGIGRTFTVHNALDAEDGIEQVEGWMEK